MMSHGNLRYAYQGSICKKYNPKGLTLQEYACFNNEIIDSKTDKSLCSLGHGRFTFAPDLELNIAIIPFLEQYQLKDRYFKLQALSQLDSDCMIINQDQNIEYDIRANNMNDIWLTFAQAAILVIGVCAICTMHHN